MQTSQQPTANIPLVGVSIVNYQSANLVHRCLETLAEEKQRWPALRVVVVDNASPDGSASLIDCAIEENGWALWVELIRAPENGGFSYGNNRAFERLLALEVDYIWLLNPDTEVREGAIAPLVTMLSDNSDVGIVGSRLEDDDGTPQVSAFNFPTPFGELVNRSNLGVLGKIFPRRVVAPPVQNQSHKADWLAGASMMMSAALLSRVGFMDEGYFLYFEEVDFCKAVMAAGLHVMYCPDSRVIHYVGAASGFSDGRRKQPRRPTYWFDSRRRFFDKNFGWFLSLVADFFWCVGYSSWILRAKLQKKAINEPPYFLRDLVMHRLKHPRFRGDT